MGSSAAPLKIVVRADASRQIGRGHLTRSLAVADRVSELRAAEIVLATRNDPLLARPTWPIDSHCPPDAEAALLASIEPDVVIADLYHPTAAQLANLSTGPWRLVCIDDDSTFELDCDLLVNPNVGSQLVHRRSARTRYLAGPQHLILRRQFEQLTEHAIRASLEELLICFGGSDPAGLTNRTLEWLPPLLPATVRRVHVVVGAGTPPPPAPADARFVVLRDVERMVDLLQAADAVLIAAGSLAYEAAASGVPAGLVWVNQTQRQEASELAQRHVAIDAGDAAGFSPQVLERWLAQLATAETRHSLSAAGRALIDGGGCERVARAIVALTRESEK